MYSFFTFDAGDIASTTEHITTLFNDLKPLLFVFIGLSIGFTILSAILETLIFSKWRKRGE